MKIDKKTFKEFVKSTGDQYKYICYAPFNTLRFNEDGLVTVCCYNTEIIIGDCRINSIQEIINSKVRKEFQKKIKKRELSQACSFCTNDIFSRNFKDAANLWYPAEVNRKNIPVNLEFKLSLKCNITCVMCSNSYRTHDSDSNDFNNYKDIYDDSFIRELNPIIPFLRNTTFNGGEPLVIDIYYEIWENIIRLNESCQITIHTNLTVLPNKLLKLLKSGRFKIVASIDSFIPSIYNSIRLGANINQTLSNLNIVLDYQKYGNKLQINFCPMKNNWKEIPEFVKYCNEKNIEFNFSTVYFPFRYSLFNVKINEAQLILKYLNKSIDKIGDGINTYRLDSFIKRYRNFVNVFLSNNDNYISKQELLDYLLKNIDSGNKLKEKLLLVFADLVEARYLNLFKAFGINHKRRAFNTINEMKTNDLIQNFKSLNK